MVGALGCTGSAVVLPGVLERRSGTLVIIPVGVVSLPVTVALRLAPTSCDPL